MLQLSRVRGSFLLSTLCFSVLQDAGSRRMHRGLFESIRAVSSLVRVANAFFNVWAETKTRSSGLFRRETASSTFRDFLQAQSRSSGLFRRDLQPKTGLFDVPRFPASPIAFLRLVSPRFAAKNGLFDVPRFLRAKPRSSGLFRRVLKPKTTSSMFRGF